MIDVVMFYSNLKKYGIDYFTGVPDSYLNEFCKHLEKFQPKEKHVVAANEGNAIGVAAGFHLATGTVPLVYMQNSGLGNAINPLLSLVDKNVYSIPMILLIGWRGAPDAKDHEQHKSQGELTIGLLEMAGIQHRILENDKCDYEEIIQWAASQAKLSSLPVAIIVKKGVLEKGKEDEVYEENQQYNLTRKEAISTIFDSLPVDTLYVASTGRITREVFWLREERGEGHDNDFLNVGAMGHTSSLALGLAVARPERLVVCLDGDAAAIMHMGCLPINAQQKLGNFIHIVINNGAHESVGGQPSIGFDINLTQIAKSSGYTSCGNFVSLKEEIIACLTAGNDKTPLFLDIHVKKGIFGKLPSLKFDFLGSKQNLMKTNERFIDGK